MVLSNDYGRHMLHTQSRQSIQLQKSDTHSLKFDIATSVEGNPKIPDPSVFEFPSAVSVNNLTRLPVLAECAVHLELLEAFYHLRLRILSSTTLDKVLGIKPKPQKRHRRKRFGYEQVKIRDPTFEKRRGDKWPFYLALAAARFQIWAGAIEREFGEIPIECGKGLQLPPIDILMVWHALLLNRSYMQQFNFRILETLVFPWQRIHEAIDFSKGIWTYTLSQESISWLLEIAGLDEDLFETLTRQRERPNTLKFMRDYIARDSAEKESGIKAADLRNFLFQNNRANAAGHERVFMRCLGTAAEQNTTVVHLVNAVQRQAFFVDKMEKQLWIHSPALRGTICRAVSRYDNFLRLFRLYPNTMLVPTLDIDLVWHTHQCSPYHYETSTKRMAGRVIDHNDQIEKPFLDTGLTRTKDLYRIRYAEDYDVCKCWDCEELLSNISALDPDTTIDEETIARLVHDNVMYYRAVEIARRKGDTLLPIRKPE